MSFIYHEDGFVFIDASYRRKILDPYVLVYSERKHFFEFAKLAQSILDGEKQDNPDCQHWADYFKGLIGKEFKRNKYGLTKWTKKIECLSFIYSVGNTNEIKIKVYTTPKTDDILLPPNSVYDFSEIKIIENEQ